MYDFTICIAGLPIGIEALYPYTKALCEGYYTDDPPVFTIRSTKETIMREDSYLEGGVGVAPDYLESLAIYRQIAERLPEYNCVLVHGSSIAVDGEGYLFAAKSGTGKSTHALLWMRKFGDARAIMINDDKPILQLCDDGIYACGTPWNGKHRRGKNVRFPLKAICFMQRAEDTSAEPLDFIKSYALLMNQTYRPEDPAKFLKTTDILDQIVNRVFTCRLHFNNLKPDAADKSYEAINREIEK